MHSFLSKQSCRQATAMTVLSREWQEGDFIKHHPGCHYYKAARMYIGSGCDE